MTGKRFVFAMWEGGGTGPPELSIASALHARAHDVRVVGDPVLEDEVRAAGARFVPWTTAPHRSDRSPETDLVKDWEVGSPFKQFARVRDKLIVGPAGRFAADFRAELDREPADAAGISLMLFGAGIAAEGAGVPFAVLAANVLPLPGWGVPPMGPGFAPARGPLGRARDAAMGLAFRRLWNTGLPALNAVRRDHGLDALGDALEGVAHAPSILVLTSRAFEYPQYRPPANVHLVGPRLADPLWAEPWEPPPGDAPLVLAGLSSTFQDQRDVLQRIATAMGTLPVRGLITTGPQIEPASISAPANVSVVRSAPHREVLRHAAALVTHAGHGTVIKGLAAGVPVVALPMGRDQDENAARVVHAGAGLRLKPKAPAEKIATAIRRVLDEPAYAEAARRIAGVIAEETAHDQAVDHLEALATGHPRGQTLHEGTVPFPRVG